MDTTERLVIDLPKELADKLRESVASGEFASESDLIGALLRGRYGFDDLDDRPVEEIRAFLAEGLADAEAGRLVPAEEVYANLRARIRAVAEEGEVTSLFYTPAAEQDLTEIALWIAADDPDAAFQFVEDIRSQCAHLIRHPSMGRVRADFSSAIRSFAHPPYTVYYRHNAAADEVEILRVWHGRRRAPRLGDLS